MMSHWCDTLLIAHYVPKPLPLLAFHYVTVTRHPGRVRYTLHLLLLFDKHLSLVAIATGSIILHYGGQLVITLGSQVERGRGTVG